MAKSENYVAKIPLLRRQLAQARASFARTSGNIERMLKFFIFPGLFIVVTISVYLVFTV